MHPPLQQVGRSKYPAREKSHPNLATPKTPEPVPARWQDTRETVRQPQARTIVAVG
jgi:hypothetical protein